MSRLRKFWDSISDAFTVQALLLLLFPAGILVGLALWLSAATTFIRLFAPLSYLFVSLLAMLLCIGLLAACVGVAKQLGWKPVRSRRRRPEAIRNAELKDVVRYVGYESAWGVANVNEKTSVLAVANEIMDRAAENEMAVWGRVGELPISRISIGNLPYCTLNIGQMLIRLAGEWGGTEYRDVQLNWAQVRRTWPRPPLWGRVTRRVKNRRASKKIEAE